MNRVVWGVDSAAAVTEALYRCVVENFGHPDFWGRYLNTIPNISDGLTSEEIMYLKNQGIKIMLIYNNFSASEVCPIDTLLVQERLYGRFH